MSIYEEAIEVFGVKDRHEKLAEEAAELTLAAIHILQGKVSPLELAEELEGIAMLRGKRFVAGAAFLGLHASSLSMVVNSPGLR